MHMVYCFWLNPPDSIAVVHAIGVIARLAGVPRQSVWPMMDLRPRQEPPSRTSERTPETLAFHVQHATDTAIGHWRGQRVNS